MSQYCETMSKSRKHLSRSNPTIKQNRKTFWRVSESSCSSHENSPAPSNDDWNYLSQEVKNDTEEEKDGLLKKLQCQVKELRHKLRILEDCIENKDTTIGTVTREKDRILGEIRRLERSNKQLKQQLKDERNHYLEEKEKFCEEMTKFKKRFQEMKITGDNRYLRGPVSVASKTSAATWQKGDCTEVSPVINTPSNILACESAFRKSTSAGSVVLYQGQDLTLQMAALRTENAKLKSIITDQEERNYELCLRFLRMKCSKNDLRKRFQDLEQEYLQVITNLMEKIDEARDEFNFIIDQKFRKPLHSTNTNYIRMVQKNSKMVQENITLRMEIQSMKKQLSKGNIGHGDRGSRKPDEPKKSNSENLTKSATKVLLTRQMKSDETLPPKASDTDSNYMSKTPTTDPSTTSTTGGKSSENTFESVNAKNKTQKTRNKLFSDDILQKIFELVDTQSNSDIHGAAKKRSESLQKIESKHGKGPEHKESPEITSEGKGKRYVECTLNAKKFHEITVQGSAKKTITSKEKVESPIAEPHTEQKTSDEVRKTRKKLSNLTIRSKNKSNYNGLKERIRPLTDSDRPEELQKDNDSLKCSSRLKADKDRVHQLGNPRQYRSRKERRQKLLMGDYCGLEENLETDDDMSPDNDSETSLRKSKTGKYVNELAMVKHRFPDDLRGKVRHINQTRKENDEISDNSVTGSTGTKIKTRNSISLHDELMEATKSQSQTDDPFWRRELNLHSLITKKSPSPRTYRVTARKSRFLSEGKNTAYVVDEDKAENVKEVDVCVGTIVEDRSRSISPLWRKKAGSEKEMPLSVKDKTTSANPMVMTDSEVVLHFLMPPTTILSTQSFIYDENCKESSFRSGKESKSSPQSVRQLMHPASNVPSSCTTVELAESAPARENGLTSRTLSAPALIESEWFNNFKMCEMKDCSTNT